MPIKESVSQDMTRAMKARDEERLRVLRMIRAEILNKEKEGAKGGSEDADLIPVLQKMIRQRREAAEEFRAGGRSDVAERELAEISIIEGYLPAEMPEEEVRMHVERAIADLAAVGPKDLGKVMGRVMKDLRAEGKTVDGSRVNAMAREMLAAAEKRES